MNSREKDLTADLLELASSAFSNHGCCDFTLPDEWSRDECDQFLAKIDAWKDTPEDYEPGTRVIENWIAMGCLADLIRSGK